MRRNPASVGFWLSVRTTSPTMGKLRRPGMRVAHAVAGIRTTSVSGTGCVAWCKIWASGTAPPGLPDANELVDMVYQYCRT
ncbi:hypothetical protein KCP73_19550 [Salmonella enterica subsp. enterica]|nr:hypothetical protein KCP73_19550 [Salmonella enterica subsp. enterica]